jgi:mono/diheme cytochrome c family protein
MNQPGRSRPSSPGSRVRPLPAALALCSLLLAAAPARAADAVQYNRDIRPILNENCFACHGADSAARKASLRLDQREVAIKKEAIVPGKPDESELVKRIFLEDDPKHMMPPPATKKKLTPAQKETLKRWIAQGAEYQPHWSFIAPTRPPVPQVRNQAWVRNPIDAFVLAKLEANGLQPAPEADRRTLARRVSLDLTGLPPSPQEVEAFVNDKDPNAYEKYVDRLLASPQWGEHRGRYWLDAARYADTHGIHFDNYREIWAYRDWVIGAYNKNMPFDQFTVEQLAGDLLPTPTLEQRVATGFSRCNITTNEGGVIPEEYVVLYARDRTETLGQTFLGLTVGCAVCHDHKFDPVAQKDFYALSAFFNNTTQNAMDGNIKDTPPVIPVPRPEDRARFDEISKQLAAGKARLEERKKASRADFDRWLKDARPEMVGAQLPTEGLRLHAPLNEGKDKTVNLVVDGQPRSVTLESGFAWVEGKLPAKGFSIQNGAALEVPEAGDFEKDQAFTAAAWVKVIRRGQTGAVVARMDNTKEHRGWDLWLEGDRPGTHIINKWPDNALKVVGKNPLKPNIWQHVCVVYDGSGKAAGVKVYIDGVLQPLEVQADKLSQTIRTEVPLKVGQRHTSERLTAAAVQDVRLYGRGLSNAEAEQLVRTPLAQALLAKPAEKRTDKEREELFGWWLVTLDAPYREIEGTLAGLQQEEVAIRSRGTVAHVMNERDGPATAYLLLRGDYDKRRGDPLPAETPASLPPLPPDYPRNRLGLAKWLVRPENPLTARVTVNRAWQELFGTGIVRTTGDFGTTGEMPSHPELLDWMAVDFRENNWDVKRFYKMLVMSSTYRQAAVNTKEKLEKDPQNRLLSRGPRFRMDAEMIRDGALASSGLLVRKLGGPSVKPYQPDGVWEAVAMKESNTSIYRRDTGENLYRRSLYTFWKRAAPPASMDILNAPNRETCVVRRERTDTPLQALVTLNDVQYVEAARHLAQVTLKEGGQDFDGRIDLMARRVICRPLNADEKKVVAEALADFLDYYKGHPEDAKKLIAVGESKADPALDAPTLAAWTLVANQLMNLDEFLNK